MTRIFTIVLILSLFISKASDKKYKLGKVTKEELRQNVCPIDAEAGAYYIFDVGEIRFDYDNSRRGDWVLKFERKFKIKVLSTDGLDEANFIIPIYDYGVNGREDLLELKGRTYNLISGKVEDFKLDKDNISEVKVIEFLTHIKYAMPQVKAGSIIEVEYTLQSDFVSGLVPWRFQKDVPVLHSEYQVTIPEFFFYNINSKGFAQIKTTKDNFHESFLVKYSERDPSTGRLLPDQKSFTLNSNSTRTSYYMDSVPAFISEPYLSSKLNFLSSINFQLSSIKYEDGIRKKIAETWENIDHQLWEYPGFGGYLNNSRSYKKILADMSIESVITQENLEEIYYKLRERVQWNEQYDFITYHTPLKIWERGSANSAGLNLMLAGLLREAGIIARPVLASTRKHGYISRFNPSFAQLNHVLILAYIDDQQFFLDMTGNNPPGLLPVHSLNVSGWLTDEKGNGLWVDLVPQEKYISKKLYNMELDPSREILHGSGHIAMQDYAALNSRNQLSLVNSTKEFEDDWLSDHSSLQLDSFSLQNANEPGKHFVMKFGFTSKNNIETLADKILISPVIGEDIENPFFGEERLYPIDFIYQREIKNFIVLKIPEGYKIETLTAPLKIALPDNKASFSYQIMQSNNIVQINYIMKINQTLYVKEDFDYLKQFFGLALEKLKQPVVISKI